MLHVKIVDFLKSRGEWYDDASTTYAQATKMLGLDQKSDISSFYLHADSGPSFVSKRGEIHQLFWHVLNTNYLDGAKKVRLAIGLADEFILLDSFQDGGGYVYDKKDGSVFHIRPGKLVPDRSDLNSYWPNFSDFLIYFFDL